MTSKWILIGTALAGVTLTGQPGMTPEGRRQFWNTVYTKETMKFRREASAFVKRAAEGRKPGRALDLGMGQGRNALFLASVGWQVTGVDISDAAIAEAEGTAKKLKLPLQAVKQSLDEFAPGDAQWDLVLLSYMQFWLAGAKPAQTEKIRNALAPGGILVIEGFASEDAPGGPAMGFKTNQLLQMFGERLRVMEYGDSTEESDWKLGTRNRVMRLVAMRELN